MKTTGFSGFLIVIATIFLYDTSMAQQVYEYRNNAGRMVQSTAPPPLGYERPRGGYSGRYKFTKSKEKTAEDIPLDFDIEKTEYRYGSLRIWGSVRGSKKNQTYEYVKVTFSLYGGRGGDLLAREYIYTDPSTIEPGGIGYIIDFGIKCKVSQLNVIEYKVTGK